MKQCANGGTPRAEPDTERGSPTTSGNAPRNRRNDRLLHEGKAWCENLESYRDFENRLPRGRSYVRSGAVLDLQVVSGKITALVSGSDLYEVAITIKPVVADRWDRIKTQCAGSVGSIIELLEGRLSERVMQVIADTKPQESMP